MTAQEARKIATDFNTTSKNSQYNTIMDIINTAAAKGEYETWIYNISILPVVKELLETNGFKVGPLQSERNESMTKITW